MICRDRMVSKVHKKEMCFNISRCSCTRTQQKIHLEIKKFKVKKKKNCSKASLQKKKKKDSKTTAYGKVFAYGFVQVIIFHTQSPLPGRLPGLRCCRMCVRNCFRSGCCLKQRSNHPSERARDLKQALHSNATLTPREQNRQKKP